MRPATLIILALALLATAGMAQAECVEGKVSMLVPAVLEETGHMLNLSVESKDGNGEIFMSTAPYVGVQTQNSERIAVSVGARIAEVDSKECDFLFRIGEVGEDTEAVDGPSAGAAMALMVLSVLSDDEFIPGLSVTGTVEPDGSVGPVGSVSAKAEAAAQNGIKVFLTPRLEMYERMLLSGVKKRQDIIVIEVRDIFEAASIAFGYEAPEENGARYLGTEIPEDIEPRTGPESAQLGRFAAIAEQTYEDAKVAVEKATERGNGEFDEYFENELAVVKELLDKKYHYTGANLAFLTTIDASAVGRNATEEEVSKTRREVISCLAGLRKPELREDNYEEVFGGEARSIWARIKLAEIVELEVEGEDVVVYKLRELEYAKGWCKLAKRLYSYEGSGRRLDEGVLEALAREKIGEAGVVVSVDSDAKWHLQAAQRAYTEGDYGAAIYDSAYALGMSVAYAEAISMTPEMLKASVEEHLGKSITGLWPSLYNMQVEYYLAAGEADLVTAYKMAVVVEGIEEMNKRAGEKLLEIGIVEEETQTAVVQDQAEPVGRTEARDALVVLAIIGVAVIFIYEGIRAVGGRNASK